MAEIGRHTLMEYREFINRPKLMKKLVEYSKGTRSALCVNCFFWGDYNRKCPKCNVEAMVRMSLSSLAKFFSENDLEEYLYFTSPNYSQQMTGTIAMKKSE